MSTATINAPKTSKRYVVLDTETTGLSVSQGHRLIEVGCVVLHDMSPTLESWHKYINPPVAVSPGAQAIHGLSNEFLSKHPSFSEVAQDLWNFLQDSTIIAHNAPFDMGFLNHEFQLLGFGTLQNEVIDTVKLARSKFPGKRANLDTLCARFGICIAERQDKGHGALLDAKLLTQVYLQLINTNDNKDTFNDTFSDNIKASSSKIVFPDIKITCSQTECETHDSFKNSL